MNLVVIVCLHYVVLLIREVTFLEYRVNVSIIVKVITVCYVLSYVEWSGETVEELAELAGLRVVGDKFCHIIKWKHYFVEFLDKSVATLDVLLTYVHAIDDSITWLTMDIAIEEEVDV